MSYLKQTTAAMLTGAISSPFESNGLKHGCYTPEANSGPLGLLFGRRKVSEGTLASGEFRRLLASTVEALFLCCTGEETATLGSSWELKLLCYETWAGLWRLEQ